MRAIAARTYRVWKQGLVSAKTISDALVDAVRDTAWTAIVAAEKATRRKTTALIRRTRVADASWSAVDHAMRLWGLSGVTRAQGTRTTIFHDGPFSTIADVKFATGGWGDGYNHRRMHGSLGMVSPNEYEANYYAALTREPQPA